MTVNDIRQSFLKYFSEKEHQIMPSASLLPAQDPTLLFTTAGMVPFKDFFSGDRMPPAPRLASVQKCLRTTDLESVGKTKRHMSFFEMLGNFSFGNYFKKEAIEFAWEYSTNFLPFPKDRIWISIFENDDEAFEIWTKHIGVPAGRVVRLGRADNFWGPAGDSGACGPCSELYLDRGEEFGTGPENQAPGGSGDRFMEFWNLVFNQFDFQKGEYLQLKKTGIDTGAGLERLATLVQNVDSVFDTDELRFLSQKISEVYGKDYAGENITPIRVLTDHVRTLCFAMSDGIFPSNESRGYVLRRVLRRALLFGRRLGQKDAKLFKIADTVIGVYGKFYPGLHESGELIKDYIRQEEDRFLKTLDAGNARLEEIIDRAANDKKAGKKISGKDAFVLYDTFGFPLEMTAEVAEQHNLTVDIDGFEEEMEKQRTRGRAAWKGGISLPLAKELRTEFIGYDHTGGDAMVTAICTISSALEKVDETHVSEQTPVYVVTDKTPFYAEGGGQLGDTGVALFSGGQAVISDTRKYGDAHIHMVTMLEGALKVGDVVHLKADIERRQALARHHSATHLLNAALRAKFGNHIKQSGSLVHYDYLRFDFTHPQGLSENEISDVQNVVNEQIKKSANVQTEVLPIAEAEKRGAVMTFGEKYGDIVRVVEMADFSKEFCGGTHVANTSEIGQFIIVKESSPGAGNRRIEAVSDKSAMNFLKRKIADAKEKLNQFAELNEALQQEKQKLSGMVRDIEKLLASDLTQCWDKLRAYQSQWNAFEKEAKKKDKKSEAVTALAASDVNAYLKNTIQEKSCSYCEAVVNDADMQLLKKVADQLREVKAENIYILKSVHSGRYNLVIATSQKYAKEKNINLSDILKKLFAENVIKGSGGGKAELVQATGDGALPEKLVAQISTLIG